LNNVCLNNDKPFYDMKPYAAVDNPIKMHFGYPTDALYTGNQYHKATSDGIVNAYITKLPAAGGPAQSEIVGYISRDENNTGRVVMAVGAARWEDGGIEANGAKWASISFPVQNGAWWKVENDINGTQLAIVWTSLGAI
jgi:hypothetical protein